ncbi:hypothetical protein BDQ17DRAFT_251332 [Cyathus striatus]|nr:hypothetical protein BDQ17DRAFT_251332 [Cyathus striatus]
MVFNLERLLASMPLSPPLNPFLRQELMMAENVQSENQRILILCFDGTGNKFGEENSNIVRFFRSLKKDQPDKQLVYYQPGIGTYNERQFFTRTFSTVASTLDQGIALHLDEHAKEGYQFIMKNYRKGDKICLFGFSRGAHTARVVAGMLYKVGILPPHNDEQLDFAFTVYQATGDDGIELSKEFKRTFAMPVTVEFVGVWDTVSSVGIIPQSHPFTSVNYAIKTFRHALALDERRARFRPNTWNEPTLEREQELDVDEPVLLPVKETRDEWVYKPPNRDVADVKEVWFTGAHADVGGGSHHNKIRDSLSYIPLRWMIKECIVTDTGILFDQKYLTNSVGFDFQALEKELQQHNVTLNNFVFDTPASTSPLNGEEIVNPEDIARPFSPASHGFEVVTPPRNKPILPFHETLTTLASQVGARIPRADVAIKHARDRHDAIAKIWDQLELARPWWFLEILPMLATYQQTDGTWMRKRLRNFGQGRYIPVHGDEVFVHESVRTRMKDPSLGYKPAAYNWDVLTDLDMIKYVH